MEKISPVSEALHWMPCNQPKGTQSSHLQSSWLSRQEDVTNVLKCSLERGKIKKYFSPLNSLVKANFCLQKKFWMFRKQKSESKVPWFDFWASHYSKWKNTSKGKGKEMKAKGQTVAFFHVNELFFLMCTVPASN